MVSLTTEWVDSLHRNGWSVWNGTGGQFAPESVARLDRNTHSLSYSLPEGEGHFEIKAVDREVKILIHGGQPELSMKVAERCISLDVDLEPFFKRLARYGDKWEWIRQYSIGRFLRSPSLFEDCCKTIFSTNTNWSRTVQMTKNLVDNLGKQINGHKAFPSPSDITRLKEGELRKVTKCGFRSKYILDLCYKADSRHDIFFGDSWMDLKNDEFMDVLLNIKGIGLSSANYLSLIYWKPNHFVVDSYVKRRCNELWAVNGDELKDFLLGRYGEAGEYSPLLLWFDITKHWYIDNERPV